MDDRKEEKGLECMSLWHDPNRKVYVTRRPTAYTIGERVKNFVNSVALLVECGCCVAMVYLLMRML